MKNMTEEEQKYSSTKRWKGSQVSWKCMEKGSLFEKYYFLICLECVSRNGLSLGHLDWDPNSVLKRLLSFMNWCFVCFQVSFPWSREIANVALKRLLSFMDWSLVSFQVVIFSKTSIPNSALKWFLSLINCWDVSFQVDIMSKASITSVALKRLFSFMDWFHVSFQAGISCKTIITKTAFKRLLSFLHEMMLCVFSRYHF